MSGAAYDPTITTTAHFVSQSPHTLAYRLFVALPGAAEWTDVDQGTIGTPEKAFGPFPANTRLGYTLLMGGNPMTQWSTKLNLRQNGAELACSPTVATGVCDAQGIGSTEGKVTLK